MRKFEVGDKVKVLVCSVDDLVGKIGEVVKVQSSGEDLTVEFENMNRLHSGGIFDGKYNRWNFHGKSLELVQTTPKFELGQKVSYVYKFQAYIGIVVRRTYGAFLNVSSEPIYDIKTYGDVIHEDIKESYVHLYEEEKIKLSKNIKVDKDGFCICDFGKDVERPFTDIHDSTAYILEQIENPFAPFPYYHLSFDEALYTKPPKNCIPDRVVFNLDKGKTTILFSLHDNGLPPYAPFTSKTVGSDKFDKSMGFLIAYYKYINREMNEDRLREQIELLFDYNKNERIMYLNGAIEQALLPNYTKERIFEVFEAILHCEGTFDLLQYEETKLKEQRKKEALRKKNINKQIKKREIEIKGLKEKL